MVYSVCNSLTSSDDGSESALTEVTSDFILDTGEKLIDGAKDFFSIHSLSKALFGNVAGAMA